MDAPLIHTARDLADPLELPYAEALRLMQQGQLGVLHGLMQMGSNYTFLASIAAAERDALVVYKPVKGEQPLWDFPDGTLYQREAAAFELSEALGWYIVPPTCIKTGEHGPGSVQLFIQHDPDRHFFNLEPQHDAQLRRICLFDILLNNADRKGGHLLLDAEEHLWGIDHGLAFNHVYKLRTVIWSYVGQEVEAALLADVERIAASLRDSQSDLRRILVALLSQREVRALLHRCEELLQARCYPMPGPGPYKPWPSI